MDSKNERNLARFFREHGIEFEAHGQCLRSPLTGRWQTPDFYIPATELYIEVKGLMTLEAIQNAAALAEVVPTYYFYNCTDYDWRPRVLHWPENVLDSATKQQLEEHAWKREAEVRAYSRNAVRGSKHDLAHNIDLQQQELLIMARDPTFARCASAITEDRLTTYIHHAVCKFNDLGLLPMWQHKYRNES